MVSHCSLSRKHVLNLYINTPHWRLALLLHLITGVLAILTLAAFGVVISGSWEPSSDIELDNREWEWSNHILGSFIFVPPTFSLIMACVAGPYLLITTRAIRPLLEFILEAIITVAMIIPTAFCFSVYGPLQWWQVNSSVPQYTFLGAWEFVGVVGLFGLLVMHSGMCGWAIKRFMERRAADEAILLKVRALNMGAGEGSEIEIGRRYDIHLPSSEERNASRCEGLVVPETETTGGKMAAEAEAEAMQKPEKHVLIMEPEVGRRRSLDTEERGVDPELPEPLNFGRGVYKPGNSWAAGDDGANRRRDQGW